MVRIGLIGECANVARVIPDCRLLSSRKTEGAGMCTYEYGHVPSVVEPYPGRPRLPIVQIPGHCRMLARYTEIRHIIHTHIAARILVWSRKTETDFNVPRSEAELIPTLKHAAPVLQVVCLHFLDQDDQLPVPSKDLSRVIPLHV